MLSAAKEEIIAAQFVSEGVLPLAADLALLENRIPKKSELAENSRLGFGLRASTLRWGWSEVKSNTALGMRGVLYDEGIRSRCTGKERDSETGLDYFGARHLSSNMGRWMSPDKPFADQHTTNPQSWNLYQYARNNPLRFVDRDGFKVIQEIVDKAVGKMQEISSKGGGTFYLDFAGIRGAHDHESIQSAGERSFEKYHSDHTSKNSEVIPNSNGFFAALFGKTNRDQADTAKAIIDATPKNVKTAFDTYSNGVNAAGAVARELAPGTLESATIVAPNTGSISTLQAIDDADNGVFLIFQSENDPALGVALFGTVLTSDLVATFGSDNVIVTYQPSHNLDRYASGMQTIKQSSAKQCDNGNPAACD